MNHAGVLGCWHVQFERGNICNGERTFSNVRCDSKELARRRKLDVSGRFTILSAVWQTVPMASSTLSLSEVVVLDHSIAFAPSVLDLVTVNKATKFVTIPYVKNDATNRANVPRFKDQDRARELLGAIRDGRVSCDESRHNDVRKQLAETVLRYASRENVLLLSVDKHVVAYVDRTLVDAIQFGVAIRQVDFGFSTEDGVELYNHKLTSPGLSRKRWWRRLFSKSVRRFPLEEPPTRGLRSPSSKFVYNLRLSNDRCFKVSVRAASDAENPTSGREGHLFRIVDVTNGKTVALEDRKTEVCVKLYDISNESAVDAREKKLQEMVSVATELGTESSSYTVCWPIGEVRNQDDRFVGFAMPFATNTRPLSDVVAELRAHSRDPKRYQDYVRWDRRDLVCIAQRICSAIERVHQTRIAGKQVLLRDISDNNVLVGVSDRRVWLIDCDSYQLKGYGSFVLGTEAFLSPSQLLPNEERPQYTLADELYSLAALLFRVLMGGKNHHYESPKWPASISDLIMRGWFPYQLNGRSGDEPNDAYARWRMLSTDVRHAFILAFGTDTRLTQKAELSAERWRKILEKYAHQLSIDSNCFDSRSQKFDRNPFPDDRC